MEREVDGKKEPGRGQDDMAAISARLIRRQQRRVPEARADR